AAEMSHIVGILCFLSILNICSAVTCVKWVMHNELHSDTCTGDVCLSFIYGGSVRNMGCGTNVVFSNRTGCFGFTQAVAGMLCA
ncbi:hypothetical protein PMAYCL1PPCAC_22240, partial [Pristionchus mayeri]